MVVFTGERLKVFNNKNDYGGEVRGEGFNNKNDYGGVHR